jgi:hypothetical protein
LRTCANTFIKKELQYIPKGWSVIVAGREADNAILYMFPERTVIGVPHPTGDRGGNFEKMFVKKPEGENTIKNEYVQAFNKLKTASSVWPTDIYQSNATKDY